MRRKFLGVTRALLFVLLMPSALAVDPVPVGGYVFFGHEPLCSLVLVNGQSVFSCDGTGRYDMLVPLDADGRITVQVFADGFAPFKQVMAPEFATEYIIDMRREASGRGLNVDAFYDTDDSGSSIRVAGTITHEGEPVCALVLVNGQRAFTCDEDNKGAFQLWVYPDGEGYITEMVFAEGFEPHKKKMAVNFDRDNDGISDVLDEDDDNDGTPDRYDACPLDPAPGCSLGTPITDAVKVDGSEWTQAVFYEYHFESVEFELVCGGNCPTTSTNHAREGSRSMRSYINRYTSDNSYRTEARLPDSNEHKKMTFDRDYWIGFSTMLPPGWTHSGGTGIMAQIHHTNDPGESGGAPPFVLKAGSGHWIVLSRGNRVETKTYTLNSAYEDVGRWVDWVIHYRPSKTSNGLLRMWKDGALVISQAGRSTTFDDVLGPRFSMGIYLPWRDRDCCDDIPAEKIVYHDALRMASGPFAGYEMIAPRD